MFPPDWLAVATSFTPWSSSRGLPLVSRPMATNDMSSQTAAMMANTARPWRRSLTIFP
jgi:hypothetical protein